MTLLDIVENLSENSHKRVNVKCDFNTSDKCKNEYTLEYRQYLKFSRDNNVELSCIYCRNKRYTGRNNPNCKYKKIDDNMFDNIDSNEKAYLLGWIASDGTIRRSGFQISIRDYDKDVLEKINKVLFLDELPISKSKNNMVNLTVNSETIAKKLTEIFKIKELIEENESYKKSYIIKFPNIDEKYLYYFIRGVFEGDGHFRYTKKNPVCGITSSSSEFLEEIIKRCELKCNINNNMFELCGNIALDFLNKVYKNVLVNDEVLFMNRKYNFYNKIAGWIPHMAKNCLYFNYVRTIAEAIPPQKQRSSDSGYDLTLIKKIKTHGNVEFFDTCIKLEPAFGYYFDLVGRSSISKSGYMLANNIGIIDRTYQGTVIVPLVKIDNNQPDLELPCRLVQIIPRQIQHLEPIEITEEELLSSERKSGGFGSTG
jgi:dUTP pyrophosphatase